MLEPPLSGNPIAPPPFPPRRLPTVRATSVAEQEAYFRAYPAPGGPWQVTGRTLVIGRGGQEEHIALEAPDGTAGAVRFAVEATRDGDLQNRPAGETLDALMERAVAWAKEHEPTHPGILPRFPVPADGYPGRVSVPLALVAVDDATRPGLYGPTRAVILPFPTGEIVGAIDAPGFDPDRWPPPHLGPWPPSGLAGLDQARLSATVRRFSALWERLLATHQTGADDPYRRDEAIEALLLLGRLDPPPDAHRVSADEPALLGVAGSRQLMPLAAVLASIAGGYVAGELLGLGRVRKLGSASALLTTG